MAASGRSDDPQATAASGSPEATGSRAPAEPATASRARGGGKDTRSQTTQEAPPVAPPVPEPETELDAMVVALFLPDSETWCTGDGTPYRAHHGRPVHVRRHHVPELVARGATEPEKEPAPQPG